MKTFEEYWFAYSHGEGSWVIESESGNCIAYDIHHIELADHIVKLHNDRLDALKRLREALELSLKE